MTHPTPLVLTAHASRWLTYQRERFPVLAHGALIAAFSGGAVAYSAKLRGAATVEPVTLLVAFACCFLFFLQLRVADEFKDAAADARYRPYRPVPRGLVTLAELRTVAMVGAAIQLVLSLVLAPPLVVPLLIVWIGVALLTVEFGAAEYLRARPLATLWSHMIVVPLIDLFATACDWLGTGTVEEVRPGLLFFLGASYGNGMVVEIGRKLRAPSDEEPGVDTYTAVWGRGRAVVAWLVAMISTMAFAAPAAAAVDVAIPVILLLGVLFLIAAMLGTRLVVAPRAGAGGGLEALSGVWTVCLYLGVGVLPWVLRS